jgi:hypothetical protein
MTPFELRSLCRSCKTPLAFAEAFKELTEAQRKTLSKTAQEIFSQTRTEEREQRGLPSRDGGIARLALLACCAWSQAQRVKGNGWRGMFPREGPWMEAVREILLARRPAWADAWIALQLDAEEPPWRLDSTLTWNDVRELMKAGVIGRPTVDGYTRLLASPGNDQFDPSRDADVLESDIWRLFAVDNSAFGGVPDKKDLNRVPSPEEGAVPRGARRELHGWPRRLYDLAQCGKLDRGRRLDEILAALWRDVRKPMRLGLMRFLAILEPTDDEMAARQSTYRELLRYDNGTVAGMALDALKRLAECGRLDVPAFVDATPAGLTVMDKLRATTALSLIDRATKKAPAELPAAVLAIGPAFNHESPEIQDLAINLLARWKKTNPSLDLTPVLKSATGLAAYNRRQLEELVADASPAISASEASSAATDLDERRRLILERLAALPEWVRAAACLDGLEQALENGDLPPAFNPEPNSCPVLSCAEPVEPIQTVDELIDAASHLLEVIDDPEEFERVIDGLLRLGGETTDRFEEKTEGLRHSRFNGPWNDLSAPTFVLCSFRHFPQLLGEWLGVKFPEQRRAAYRHSAYNVLDLRIELLLTRFRARRFGPVLATPTHRGGWIDPRVFVERLKSLRDAEKPVSRFDLIGGLLRLAPDFRDVALASAADLPLPIGPIVRYALGGEERPTEADRSCANEWLAAGRTRRPRGWLEELRVLELDEREPDGITRAAFRFESEVEFQESQFGRWSGRQETQEQAVSVAPRPAGFEEVATRPTVALASCLLQLHSIDASQNWEARLLASYWPANPDGCLAVACSKLRGRLDDVGLVFEAVPGWMAPLQAVDQGWSEMARTALWLGLLSRNDQSRGTAIDALIEGIADGRADTAALADTLLHIASGGWIKLNRLADSLREVTRTSILAERVVAGIMDRLIASWNELPRDGRHVLALQMELLSNLQQGLSPAARDALSTVKGTGKAAKLAKQLSALEPHPQSPALREAAVQASEGRLARAERIYQFFERNPAQGSAGPTRI